MNRQISVIVPVYNCRCYLETAILSILNQPYKAIDIVIVDDGSTDGSTELCERIAGKYNHVHVIHKENGGVSSARNTGIEYVLSQINSDVMTYVGFVDADDLWCPNAITEELFKTKVQLPEVLAFGSVHSDNSMSRFSKPIAYSFEEKQGNESVWTVKGHFAACLYRASLLRHWKIRFSENLRYSEDKIFQMKCVFLAERILFLSHCLYVYRENSASAMHKAWRIPATEYYLPIISGWIESDDFINWYEPVTNRHIHAGYILAGIYLLDMAAEHYKQGGTAKKLNAVLYNHPHFNLLEQLHPQEVSETQYKNCRLLLEKPTIFGWKYRLIGIGVRAARALIHVPAIRMWSNKKKYPYAEIRE